MIQSSGLAPVVGQVRGPPAAGDEPGLLAPVQDVQDVQDVLQDAPVMVEVDQRADLCGRVGGRPDAQTGGALGDTARELLVQRALYEHPGPGGAALPVEGEHAEHDRVDRGLDVGVGEDDDGGLAAQFHGRGLQAVGAGTQDVAAGGGRAGEGDQRDTGVIDERLTRLRAGAVQDVHDTGRYAPP